MRIADTVFRGGHLSEEALAEAWYTGDHPAHLDQCDTCAARALDLARWLDDTKQIAIESADAVFTPERLEAQHTQILRKLEQIERPSKLLSFPRAAVTARAADFQMPVRQATAPWIAVAAACLALGVVAGRLSVWEPASAPTQQVQSVKAEPVQEPSPVAPAADLFPDEIAQPQINSLRAIESLTTPQVVVAKASNTGRRR